MLLRMHSSPVVLLYRFSIIALIFLIPHGLPAERSSLVSPLTSSVTSNTLFRKKTFSPSTGISCSLVIAQNPSSR